VGLAEAWAGLKTERIFQGRVLISETAIAISIPTRMDAAQNNVALADDLPGPPIGLGRRLRG